jgi:hypothetical protein
MYTGHFHAEVDYEIPDKHQNALFGGGSSQALLLVNLPCIMATVCRV